MRLKSLSAWYTNKKSGLEEVKEESALTRTHQEGLTPNRKNLILSVYDGTL
jgi:hypothetical protein